jgi:hypothetical protein
MLYSSVQVPYKLVSTNRLPNWQGLHTYCKDVAALDYCIAAAAVLVSFGEEVRLYCVQEPERDAPQ